MHTWIFKYAVFPAQMANLKIYTRFPEPTTPILVLILKPLVSKASDRKQQKSHELQQWTYQSKEAR
jgi:hypothetical protein